MRAASEEGEDVVPAVVVADLHQRGAGVERVAQDADPEVRGRRCYCTSPARGRQLVLRRVSAIRPTAYRYKELGDL